MPYPCLRCIPSSSTSALSSFRRMARWPRSACWWRSLLAQRTARMAGVNAAKLWNLCVMSLCAALVAERLLLVAVNWSAIRRHPQWTLGLAMIHHPLVAAHGAIAGGGRGSLVRAGAQNAGLATADALAAPLALGLAFEQLGALLAGSGYGTEATVPWAVTYTSPAAALWSGTPLGVPSAPGAGLCGARVSDAGRSAAGLAAGATPRGRRGRRVPDGDGRGDLLHRVVARPRGTRMRC